MNKHFALLLAFILIIGSATADNAHEILSASGIKGGLVVCIGCEDAELLVGLRPNDSYLVQGLDADARIIEQARKSIKSKGLYGKVSVDVWDGKGLPYVDNSVNLVVVQGSRLKVPSGEVERVLAPRGVVLVNGKKTVKSVPPEIDEWTHFLYSSAGNPVGKDKKVGPPYHLQWEGGPKFGRSHENMSSVSAMVTSGGRVFSIMDEGPKASIHLPSEWYLTARDAFNGVVLWKRPIETWHARHFKLKSGPFQLPRRLVASGDRLFVTPGLYAPLLEIDAATGETVETYGGTEHTEEILYSAGRLVLVVNPNKEKIPFGNHDNEYTISLEGKREIVAIDSGSQNEIWRKHFDSVTPLTIAADEKQVYFHKEGEIWSLVMETGKVLWHVKAGGQFKIMTNFSPALLVHNSIVYLAEEKEVTAISATDGEQLWSVPCAIGRYRSPVSVYIINDLIWLPESGSLNKNQWGNAEGKFTGCDLITGEKKREIVVDISLNMGIIHHRCCILKGVDKYILSAWPGIEFVNTETGELTTHSWVRGACLYGIMPANGLIYTPPHPCACFLQAKMWGYHALAAKRAEDGRQTADDRRLEKGTAFSEISNLKSKISCEDWPTYRGDTARSGFVKTSVPAKLKQSWKLDLGDKVSAPVIADGKVFVSSINEHAVYALDEKNGKETWSFTASGRVDSPPTIHKGITLFGSRDGCVYCLRASDGALVWKFRAARDNRRIVSYGQLESVWPVHGSILVKNNAAYFVAGKSSYLDDGIYLYRLDILTGEKLSETKVYMRDARGRQPEVPGAGLELLRIQGALPDILSCDDEYIYMRHMAFDLDGNIVDQPGNDHLYTPTGFLEDSWFHRSYWNFSRGNFVTRVGIGGGGGFGSRIMVMDDERLFKFGRDRAVVAMHKPDIEHFLAASKKVDSPTPESIGRKGSSKKKSKDAQLGGLWSNLFPMHVRAMVLAQDTLFVAGPKGDWVNSADAFEGKEGIAVMAVSASDGSIISEHELQSSPSWGGMAAANGKLFLSLSDGIVLCME